MQQGTAVATASCPPTPYLWEEVPQGRSSASLHQYLGTYHSLPAWALNSTPGATGRWSSQPEGMTCKGYILTAPDLVPMAMMRSSGSKARALGWLGKPCSTVCGRGEGICPGTAAPRPSRAHPRQPSGSAAAAHWDTSRVYLGCACVVNPETGSHPPAGMEGLSPWAPPRAKPPSLSTPVSTPLCTGPWQQTKRKDRFKELQAQKWTPSASGGGVPHPIPTGTD